jgi:hypothetical protein
LSATPVEELASGAFGSDAGTPVNLAGPIESIACYTP